MKKVLEEEFIETTVLELEGDFSDSQVDALNRTSIEDLPYGANILKNTSYSVTLQHQRVDVLKEIIEPILIVLKNFQESGKKAIKSDSYGSNTALFTKEVTEVLRDNGVLRYDRDSDLGKRFDISLYRSGRSYYIKLVQYTSGNTYNQDFYVAEVENQLITKVQTIEEFTKQHLIKIDLDVQLTAMKDYANFLKVANEYKDKINYQLFQDVALWLK